jgi:hypothetical protein
VTYCCETWETLAKANIVQKYKGLWHVVGCCEHCFVLDNLKFCPYCGTPMMGDEKGESDDAQTSKVELARQG